MTADLEMAHMKQMTFVCVGNTYSQDVVFAFQGERATVQHKRNRRQLWNVLAVNNVLQNNIAFRRLTIFFLPTSKYALMLLHSPINYVILYIILAVDMFYC